VPADRVGRRRGEANRAKGGHRDMDDKHFDSLARAMAAGTSRRSLLKLLAGGAAASGIAVVAKNEALAECHGISCSSADQCCEGAPECSGGVCVVASAPAPDPAPASDSGGASSAETMPATGTGPLEKGSQFWLVAAAAGGAAAWLAHRAGREAQNESDTSS